tara:strand:- start:3591 stop:4076 length:486 start_codon:yes stop_codon:yes gene_type:complete
MANFTGANVTDVVEIETYQPDIFGFGIASNDSKVSHYITQTTNDIFRELRIRWWPIYKTNVYTDITVLDTSEMVNTKINLDQFKRAGVYLFLYKYFCPSLTKFRPEADKDRFERMAEHYQSEYNKEFRSILEDGVEYDSKTDGTISVNEREPLHGSRRLTR